MSLHPQDIPAVPITTAMTARAAFPQGNRYMTMRDGLGTFYADQDFAALFATRGQPADTPGDWPWSWFSSLPKGCRMSRRRTPCAAESTGNMP